ncbi:hypothetical protein D3C78_1524720 [compost metagenome]
MADGGENRRFHEFEGHRVRDSENLPLMGQVVAAVLVVRVDGNLLLTAEHQYRGACHDQWP